jgi:hypothetical protein
MTSPALGVFVGAETAAANLLAPKTLGGGALAAPLLRFDSEDYSDSEEEQQDVEAAVMAYSLLTHRR